jgi:hypothetical protein
LSGGRGIKGEGFGWDWAGRFCVGSGVERAPGAGFAGILVGRWLLLPIEIWSSKTSRALWARALPELPARLHAGFARAAGTTARWLRCVPLARLVRSENAERRANEWNGASLRGWRLAAVVAAKKQDTKSQPRATIQTISWLPCGPANLRPNQCAAPGIVGRPSARTRGKEMRKALRHGEV